MQRWRFFCVIIFACVGCFLGCGKKKNEKLAQNYYKLGMAEIGGEINGPGAEALACKKALAYMDKALEQMVTAEFLALKATLLFKLQRFDESGRFFNLALKEKMPRSLKGEILNNYACLLAQNGQEDRAFSLWNSLIEDEYYLTPEVVYVNQGRIYAERDDYLKAKHCFLKALELAPDYLDANYYLAMLAQHHGDASLAKSSISSALFFAPDNKDIQLVAKTFGIDATLPSPEFGGAGFGRQKA